MKNILFFISFLVLAKVSYAQGTHSDKLNLNPIFVEASFRTNITNSTKVGFGVRISGGYSITDNLSLLISTGYMSSYSVDRSFVSERYFDFNLGQYISTARYESGRQYQMVPLDLSIKYSFPVFGIKSYALLRGGWDFMFNYSNYDVTTVTKNESTNQILETKNGKASSFSNLSNSINDFGLGLGGGALIPLNRNLNLDVSYLLFTNSLYPSIHSVAVGINYKL